MRVSNFPITTLKEAPANAEIISHQLMLRAGLIRRLASGLYTWLPLGLQVLRNVEAIVREEMNASGALELLMPTIQPGELWEQSGRWEQYGAELLRVKDRHDRDFCYGPTHEEVITDLASKEIHSYKQLPLNYYQVQLKFRDERRPRFGVMRAREFLMKDAYSFHINDESLQQTYELMHQTYCRIFDRLGLEYRPVTADGGSIGGNHSHEFHVLAESGEDAIAVSDQSDYAANVELAATLPQKPALSASMAIGKIETPAKKSIQEVADFLKVGMDQCLKMLVVKGEEDGQFVGILIRGDHQLNEIKAEKIDAIKSPLTLATEAEIHTLFNCEAGFLGPYNAPNIPLYADYAALAVSDFVCGANETDMHYQGVNWQRDLPVPEAADLRNVREGDPSPDGKGNLRIRRGIEVGHIFQLGTKYSEKLNCSVLDENGKSKVLTMGCYGIGISRIVAAAIEQNNDSRGIIWPNAISPYDVYLAPINLHKSLRLKEAVETLYERLQAAGHKVLFDDRKIRPGAMFADMDLIGIPHRIVFSEKGLDKGSVEYSQRGDDADAEHIAIDEIVSYLAR